MGEGGRKVDKNDGYSRHDGEAAVVYLYLLAPPRGSVQHSPPGGRQPPSPPPPPTPPQGHMNDSSNCIIPLHNPPITI